MKAPDSQPHANGFTLVELLVVMVLIVVLAGLVLKAVRAVEEKGKIQQAKADLGMLVMALERYRVDHGQYPIFGANDSQYFTVTPPASLWAYLDVGCTYRKDRRSYINNWPKHRISNGQYLDPWGRAYRYGSPDDRPSYMANAAQQGIFLYVYSAGPDGVYNPSWGGAGTDDIIGTIGSGFASGAETLGR